VGKRVGVHCTGEPGALYAVQVGVASIDHAYQLSPETMRIMREKQIYAVPTFTISEYFADMPSHSPLPSVSAPCRPSIQKNFASNERQAFPWR
jgi:imidazolonepropionase-like amidohydrolase